MKKPPREVMIVGGGFAGLAAAMRLLEAGVKVRLFEKRPFLGGRAYSFRESKTGDVVDNGQHLMMGAYHETLEFLKKLGSFHHLQIQKKLETIFIPSARQKWKLRSAPLPAPLHLLGGVLGFKGFSWRDKLNLPRLARLGKTQSMSGMLLKISCLDFLKQAGQSTAAIQNFWEPLILATLNESPEQASAQLFWEVLQQGLLTSAQNSKLIFPKVGFDELYTEPAKEYLLKRQAPIHFQSQITRLEKIEQGWKIGNSLGETFEAEAVIFAVPPRDLAKLWRGSSQDFASCSEGLEKISSAPIVSINLWFEDFTLPNSFVGLLNSPLHWLFDKAQILGEKKSKYFTMVVSGARELAEKNKEELLQLAQSELVKFFPSLEGKKLRHSQIIKEQTATFGNQWQEQSLRLSVKTSWPGIYLAGDWTQTGLPATIESAVRSGNRAAELVLQSL